MSAQPTIDRLRFVLRSNAAFSSLCAVATLLASRPLAAELSLRASDLVGLGVQLLIFASFLVFLAARERLGSGWTLWAVLGLGIVDLLWVAGTAQALGSGSLEATNAGSVLALGVAAAVGLFGALELWLWRVLRRAARTARVAAGTV